MARISSLAASSPPPMSGMSTPHVRGAHAAGQKSQRFEIEDDDLDELVMDDGIPCSSPYFTQPTQIVEKRSTMLSSSPVPETPGSSTIEVAASSPFQAPSRPLAVDSPAPKTTVKTTSPTTGGRLASLMAPPGTEYRPPVTHQPRPAVQREPLDDSDDDIAKMRRADSSDDDAPLRGDIKPSLFGKKSPPPGIKKGLASSTKAERDLPDILPNDIPDIRLRYLTKEVYKAVKTIKPTSFRACRDALLKNDKSVEDAIRAQIDGGRPLASSGVPKAASAKSRLQNATGIGSPPTSVEPSPAPQKPRKRLIQGRRNRSPSPPPIFSASPSHSSVSTPASSAEADVEPRRRLQKGRRPKSDVPNEVITVDSGSGSDDEFPDISKIASRKRKATSQPVVKETKAAKTRAPPVVTLPESEDEEALAESSNSDSGNEAPSQANLDEEDQVIKYLGTCTAEELARMAGVTVADAQLVVSARPFSSLTDVAKISRRKQTKAKSKNEVGLIIIEKLSTWFKAFTAAASIIEKCDKRGVEIQASMSAWGRDRNGQVTDSSRQLPISEKPALMDSSVQLKSYQLLGLNWMNLLHEKLYSGILADDMGLGKTCQVISFICHLRTQNIGPCLIVVPPSVLENWRNEFEKFAPQITVLLYQGTGRENIDTDNAREHDVVLTSYSQVEKRKEDLGWLQELGPYASVWDEGHKFKNINTQGYKQLIRVPSEWRLVLSGTPVQNNLKELLGLLHFVEPSLFRDGDLDRLRTIFEAKVPNKDVHNFAALARERVGNARTMIAPFILQRRKDDVLELPSKIETRVVVPMHPEQKALYDEIKGTYIQEASTSKKSSTVSNPWMQLRKAAIHHQLFRRYFTEEMITKMTNILWKKCSAEEIGVQSLEERHKDMYKKELMGMSDFTLHVECNHFRKYIGQFDIPHRSWEESPKVQKLLELVRGYMANGDRCLVFSRFKLVVDILKETLCHADIRYCELTGAVGTGERFPEVERFNNDPTIPVFLLTTGAGGTGLNLVSANKIIIFDMSDNPQDDIQASNRAHRIGQTRKVEIIRFVTEGSVEVLVYNSCIKKLMLAACVEGTVDDDESVEQECRKKMLLDQDADTHEDMIDPVSNQLPA